MTFAQFDFNVPEVKIIPCGDWHIGHPACMIESIKGTLNYIKSKQNTYIIGMGDFCEAASKTSVGAGWVEQTMNLDEQKQMVIDLLMPVRKRILGMLIGNHELRGYKDIGSTSVYDICRALGIADKFYMYGQLFAIKVKDNIYTIYATHGDSGARTSEGKMRACKKSAEFITADIFCYGHVHHLAIDTQPIFASGNLIDSVIERKRYFVLTGYFMRWWQTYAQMKNYAPGKTGVAKIKLFGDRWDIHVSI